MEIRGFGSFTPIERHLATLTIDEKNEMYLNGKLDRLLDETEKEVKTKAKKRQRRNGENKREIL